VRLTILGASYDSRDGSRHGHDAMTRAPIATSSPELLTSISHYLWPLLAAAVLWKLMPVIREVLRTRTYKISVGGLSVDVQTASEGLQKQITDLQNQVAQLKESGPVPPVGTTERATGSDRARVSPSPPPGARILWVDDNPENNVYEIQSLETKRISVTTATSTAEALKQLHAGHYFAVITDLGRVEDGSFNPDAGLELVKVIRRTDTNIAIYVFTTATAVAQRADELQAAGANAVTSSSVRLLEVLHVIGDSAIE
jgi:CheY-like chemotaxis protein